MLKLHSNLTRFNDYNYIIVIRAKSPADSIDRVCLSCKGRYMNELNLDETYDGDGDTSAIERFLESAEDNGLILLGKSEEKYNGNTFKQSFYFLAVPNDSSKVEQVNHYVSNLVDVDSLLELTADKVKSTIIWAKHQINELQAELVKLKALISSKYIEQYPASINGNPVPASRPISSPENLGFSETADAKMSGTSMEPEQEIVQDPFDRLA